MDHSADWNNEPRKNHIPWSNVEEVFMSDRGPTNRSIPMKKIESLYRIIGGNLRGRRRIDNLSIISAKLFKRPENEEMFNKLSEEEKVEVCRRTLHGNFSPIGVESYLNALLLAKQAPLDIQKEIKKVVDRGPRGTDFSGTLLQMCSWRHRRPGGQHAGLEILTEIYGPKTILEVLIAFDKAEINWTVFNISEIIRDWEDVKSFPMEWVIQTYTSETQHSEELFWANTNWTFAIKKTEELIEMRGYDFLRDKSTLLEG